MPERRGVPARRPGGVMDSKKTAIRNSTVDFLVFAARAEGETIEVRYKDKTIWPTQKRMAKLFATSTDNVGLHLKNIFSEGELDEGATSEDSSVVQTEGKRSVRRAVKFYNLDAIKGYIIDRKRMENGAFLEEDYFEHLLAEVREIRLGERRFYQKITDIYATSVDYNKDASGTKEFFAKVLNKFHFAIRGHTAAELIKSRADSEKTHMGLANWKNSPDGRILKSGISVAKNYLTREELESLGRIVNAYLDLAEERAKRKIPMSIEDWARRLNAFLQFDEREILQDAGTISAKIAKEHGEGEFAKYRIIQDRLFESDFDREIKKIEKSKSKLGEED